MNHVCNTNYPLAVKKRDAGWIDGEWPSYSRTIYSTNPPYAASINQYCDGASTLLAGASVVAAALVSM
tara:strand:- start:91 stop:294 length:204 start_codon:yes stop_codon:yes gene_type:complete